MVHKDRIIHNIVQAVDAPFVHIQTFLLVIQNLLFENVPFSGPHPGPGLGMFALHAN